MVHNFLKLNEQISRYSVNEWYSLETPAAVMGLGGAKNLPIIRATKYARELEVHLVQANYPK